MILKHDGVNDRMDKNEDDLDYGKNKSKKINDESELPKYWKQKYNNLKDEFMKMMDLILQLDKHENKLMKYCKETAEKLKESNVEKIGDRVEFQTRFGKKFIFRK